MKKTTIIIIQTIVIVLALVYAFVKNVEARMNVEEALRQRTLMDQSAQICEKEKSEMREAAELATKEVFRRMIQADEEVKAAKKAMEDMSKCCKGKK